MLYNRKWLPILLALVLALVLSGCQATAAQPQIPVVAFTARDHSFSGPESIPSGWVQLTLENEGADFHHLQLVRLAEGKTVQDLAAALTTDPAAPDWAEMIGGPNAIGPGQSAAATVHLPPGNYAVICVVPDREGVLHIAHGMFRDLTVTANAQAAAVEPAADVTLTLVDYSFTLSTPLQAGLQTIRVENQGSHDHEIWLAKLAPGKSVNDLLASLAPGAPPEAWDSEALGGFTWIEPGAHGYFTVDLEPGDYAIVCFVPDHQTASPHFALGMMQQFRVQ